MFKRHVLRVVISRWVLALAVSGVGLGVHALQVVQAAPANWVINGDACDECGNNRD